MPRAKVRLEDGRIAVFDVPDGTSPQQVTEFASRNREQFSQPQAPAAPQTPQPSPEVPRQNPRTTAPAPSGLRVPQQFQRPSVSADPRQFISQPPPPRGLPSPELPSEQVLEGQISAAQETRGKTGSRLSILGGPLGIIGGAALSQARKNELDEEIAVAQTKLDTVRELKPVRGELEAVWNQWLATGENPDLRGPLFQNNPQAKKFIVDSIKDFTNRQNSAITNERAERFRAQEAQAAASVLKKTQGEFDPDDNFLSRGIRQGMKKAEISGIKVLNFLGNVTGLLDEDRNDLAGFFSGVEQAYSTAQQESAKTHLQKEWEPLVAGVTESMITRAVSTGLPGGPIGTFTAKAASEGYHSGRAAGLRGAELASYTTQIGALEGGITMGFQSVGLGGFESRGFGKGVVNFFKQLGAELLEEEAVEIGSAIAEANAGVNPGALEPEALRKRLVDTALATIINMAAAKGVDVTTDQALKLLNRHTKTASDQYQKAETGEKVEVEKVDESVVPIAEEGPVPVTPEQRAAQEATPVAEAETVPVGPEVQTTETIPVATIPKKTGAQAAVGEIESGAEAKIEARRSKIKETQDALKKIRLSDPIDALNEKLPIPISQEFAPEHIAQAEAEAISQLGRKSLTQRAEEAAGREGKAFEQGVSLGERAMQQRIQGIKALVGETIADKATRSQLIERIPRTQGQMKSFIEAYQKALELEQKSIDLAQRVSKESSFGKSIAESNVKGSRIQGNIKTLTKSLKSNPSTRQVSVNLDNVVSTIKNQGDVFDANAQEYTNTALGESVKYLESLTSQLSKTLTPGKASGKFAEAEAFVQEEILQATAAVAHQEAHREQMRVDDKWESQEKVRTEAVEAGDKTHKKVVPEDQRDPTQRNVLQKTGEWARRALKHAERGIEEFIASLFGTDQLSDAIELREDGTFVTNAGPLGQITVESAATGELAVMSDTQAAQDAIRQGIQDAGFNIEKAAKNRSERKKINKFLKGKTDIKMGKRTIRLSNTQWLSVLNQLSDSQMQELASSKKTLTFRTQKGDTSFDVDGKDASDLLTRAPKELRALSDAMVKYINNPQRIARLNESYRQIRGRDLVNNEMLKDTHFPLFVHEAGRAPKAKIAPQNQSVNLVDAGHFRARLGGSKVLSIGDGIAQFMNQQVQESQAVNLQSYVDNMYSLFSRSNAQTDIRDDMARWDKDADFIADAILTEVNELVGRSDISRSDFAEEATRAVLRAAHTGKLALRLSTSLYQVLSAYTASAEMDGNLILKAFSVWHNKKRYGQIVEAYESGPAYRNRWKRAGSSEMISPDTARTDQTNSIVERGGSLLMKNVWGVDQNTFVLLGQSLLLEYEGKFNKSSEDSDGELTQEAKDYMNARMFRQVGRRTQPGASFTEKARIATLGRKNLIIKMFSMFSSERIKLRKGIDRAVMEFAQSEKSLKDLQKLSIAVKKYGTINAVGLAGLYTMAEVGVQAIGQLFGRLASFLYDEDEPEEKELELPSAKELSVLRDFKGEPTSRVQKTAENAALKMLGIQVGAGDFAQGVIQQFRFDGGGDTLMGDMVEQGVKFGKNTWAGIFGEDSDEKLDAVDLSEKQMQRWKRAAEALWRFSSSFGVPEAPLKELKNLHKGFRQAKSDEPEDKEKAKAAFNAVEALRKGALARDDKFLDVVRAMQTKLDDMPSGRLKNVRLKEIERVANRISRDNESIRNLRRTFATPQEAMEAVDLAIQAEHDKFQAAKRSKPWLGLTPAMFKKGHKLHSRATDVRALILELVKQAYRPRAKE